MTAATPRRIQRQRTKGWRAPKGAIYVGRPTRWGNPYQWTDYTPMRAMPGEIHAVADEHRRRFWAVTDFRVMLRAGAAGYPSVEQIRAVLAGRDLMCWCPLVDAAGQPVPCHADVLLDIANDRSHP